MSADPRFDHYPLLDEIVMEEARATMRDKFPRLIEYYLEDTESYLQKMDAALQENDPIALVPPAHITKSSSRQLGLMRVAEIAAYIESTSRSALRGECGILPLTQNLSELKAAFDHTRQQLRMNLPLA